jgi:hypothetical protein
MKKLIVLTLILFLMGFSMKLAAKNGATLNIQKKSGQLISGELIGIKDHSLMLMDSSGAYVSCPIDEAHAIVIGKKSKFSTGAIPGFILGAIGGAIIGSKAAERPSQPQNWGEVIPYVMEEITAPVGGALVGGIIGGGVGLTIGGIISSSSGSQEKFLIEGKSPEQIKAVLERLRSKARFPEYQ